jgi:hypothetical protein
VQHRPPLPGQLAEQGERDHALAAAGTAGHDDDGLGVLLMRTVDGVQDKLVGQPLFGQEHELLLVPDLGRGQLQQLTRRPYVAGQEPVRRGRARRGRESVPQVVDERAPGRLREQPGPVVLHSVIEVRDVGLRGVMQVGDTVQGVRAVLQDAHVAAQVVAVALGLENRMELRAAAHVPDEHQLRIGLEKLGVAPLLQLDHQVRVTAGAAVLPGQHHIGALAGQGQLVFDEHLDLAQPSLHEILGQDGEAAVPGPAFGGRHREAGGHAHVLGQLFAEPLLHRRGKHPGSPTEDRHRPTPSAARFLVRVGACPRSGDQRKPVGPQ